jgi:hypothetical protein
MKQLRCISETVALFCVAVSVATGLFLWGHARVGSRFKSDANWRPLRVPDIELGAIKAGDSSQGSAATNPLTIVVKNETNRPIRVVGVQQGCVNGFCCTFDFNGPIEVASGGTMRINGEIGCNEGQFGGELELYCEPTHDSISDQW